MFRSRELDTKVRQLSPEVLDSFSAHRQDRLEGIRSSRHNSLWEIGPEEPTLKIVR